MKGRVTATKPFYASHTAWTILTVQVERAYKGSPAKEILVYEDGGLVPLKDVLPDLEGKADTPEFTDEQIATGVVDMRMMGAAHSEPGQQVLLFLMDNPNAEFTGSYMIVSSMYGRFISKRDGEWERLGMRTTDEGSGKPSDLGRRFESKKSDAEMEAVLAKVK